MNAAFVWFVPPAPAESTLFGREQRGARSECDGRCHGPPPDERGRRRGRPRLRPWNPTAGEQHLTTQQQSLVHEHLLARDCGVSRLIGHISEEMGLPCTIYLAPHIYFNLLATQVTVVTHTNVCAPAGRSALLSVELPMACATNDWAHRRLPSAGSICGVAFGWNPVDFQRELQLGRNQPHISLGRELPDLTKNWKSV